MQSKIQILVPYVNGKVILMQTISINGHDLTKIKLKLNPLQDGVFSYITYPVEKFTSEVREGLFYLSIPSHLMVELYPTFRT